MNVHTAPKRGEYLHSAWEFARAFLPSRLTYVSRTAFVEGVVKIFSNFISTLPDSTED